MSSRCVSSPTSNSQASRSRSRARQQELLSPDAAPSAAPPTSVNVSPARLACTVKEARRNNVKHAPISKEFGFSPYLQACDPLRGPLLPPFCSTATAHTAQPLLPPTERKEVAGV